MTSIRRGMLSLAGGVVAMAALAGSAMAQGSVKDGPADAGRKLEWTWNIAGTSDYVFRGFSQSAEKPAFQMGADLTYGLFYAGLWGSSIDFGQYTDANGQLRDVGGFAEIDWYMGIKPVVGAVTFDLGVIYYSYFGAKDGDPLVTGKPREWDYVELKGGASVSPIKNLTTGVTLFWSPEYTNKTGSVFTLEGTAAYELPKMWIFTPTIGGTLGSQWGSFSSDKFNAGLATYTIANGDDNYLYWNAGVALTVDKLTLDFRYWDTNVANTNPALGTQNFCKGPTFQCDERFVFTAKITY